MSSTTMTRRERRAAWLAHRAHRFSVLLLTLAHEGLTDWTREVQAWYLEVALDNPYRDR